MSIIYKRIRERREELGLSQDDLAKRMGYKSRSSINKIEMGTNDIPQSKIDAFAVALDTTAAWLMGYDSAEEKKFHSVESVAYRITTLMNFRDLSMADLARLTQTDEEELYDYIHNTPDSKFNYNDKKLHEIAKALDVNGIDVFFGFNTFSENAVENYINFLLDKINNKLPLAKRENDILLRYFNSVNNDEFLSYPDVIPDPGFKKVPLLGMIAHGDPALALDFTEEMIAMPDILHIGFAVRCNGDALNGARILDGDIIYIQEQDIVNNGELAAVVIDGKMELKRVYKDTDSDILTLMAENAAIPPMIFQGDQLKKVRIVGKVVGFFSSQIK